MKINKTIDLQKKYIIVDSKNPNSDYKNSHSLLGLITDNGYVITKCVGGGMTSNHRVTEIALAMIKNMDCESIPDILGWYMVSSVSIPRIIEYIKKIQKLLSATK